jgi:multimeric flavodoxin WrbA
LNLSDFSISCCNRCQYECFNTPKSCPLPDDLRTVYEKLTLSDGLLCAVPTYGGHANGLYRAFMERMQMMNPEFQQKHFIKKLKGLIIIGNLRAGGDRALQEVTSDFSAQLPKPEFLLLSAGEFGRRALDGDLTESSAVKSRLDSLITTILS